MYREGHLVADLGWVDNDLECSTTLRPADMPIQPDSHLPQPMWLIMK